MKNRSVIRHAAQFRLGVRPGFEQGFARQRLGTQSFRQRGGNEDILAHQPQVEPGIEQLRNNILHHLVLGAFVFYSWATTVFFRRPMPSISTSITSPTFTLQTPGGVPVHMTSPGRRVMKPETKLTRRGTENIMRLVWPSCFNSPFTQLRMDRLWGSMPVTRQGPRGPEPSTPLALVIHLSFFI